MLTRIGSCVDLATFLWGILGVGYCSYKWAKFMSADAFAVFEEVGLDNEDGVHCNLEISVVGKTRESVISRSLVLGSLSYSRS